MIPRIEFPHGITAGLIAFAVMALAVGIVAGLFLFEIPANNSDVAMVVLGIAVGWAGTIVNFHFGSSKGSQRKTDMMAQAAAEQVENDK